MAVSACSTTPSNEEDRQDRLQEGRDTLQQFRSSDADIARHIDQSYGYAVFPTVGKGGLVVGGAGGEGVVYRGGQPIGFCTLSQASIGLQAGGQSYSELILFENERTLNDFTDGTFAFTAQTSAVAAAAGAGANAKYDQGVMVFTLGEKGLMYEASVGGQKFNYEPM